MRRETRRKIYSLLFLVLLLASAIVTTMLILGWI
jgi:hypothetical protein